MLICQVCGKKITKPKYAGARIRVDGYRYYFCCMDCKTRFLNNVAKYGLDEEYAEIVKDSRDIFSEF